MTCRQDTASNLRLIKLHIVTISKQAASYQEKINNRYTIVPAPLGIEH